MGQPGSVVHDFSASLSKSNTYVDAPWWKPVYHAAFAGIVSMTSVREDGWAQRGGIDRVIVLKCGRTITIDEKVREKDYGDILLERWSDERRKVPGWVQKPLACDYIAYAIAPTRMCYLLPTLVLQRAWRACGPDWVNRYTEIRAQNNGYVTVSVGVPIDELFRAMTGAMAIHWTASSTAENK